jgi:hypothetical protein
MSVQIYLNLSVYLNVKIILHVHMYIKLQYKTENVESRLS